MNTQLQREKHRPRANGILGPAKRAQNDSVRNRYSDCLSMAIPAPPVVLGNSDGVTYLWNVNGMKWEPYLSALLTILPSRREQISLRLPLDDDLASTVLSRRDLEQAFHPKKSTRAAALSIPWRVPHAGLTRARRSTIRVNIYRHIFFVNPRRNARTRTRTPRRFLQNQQQHYRTFFLHTRL